MKCLKIVFAVTLSVFSINTFATEVSAVTIMDNYIGAGHNSDVNGSMYKYDIDKMIVDRNVSGDVTTLNVDIFTSFYNDISSSIKLGDLFMAADDSLNGTGSPWNPNGTEPYGGDRYATTGSNTGTNWNYVYDLGGSRSSTSGTGKLKSGYTLSNLKESKVNYGHRDNQAVMIYNSTNHTEHNGSSNWFVGGSSYVLNGISYGKVSFSFDVSNTALATANQIAFRWAMTCANDIIEGLATLGHSPRPGDVTVPEPSTVVLMLLAMAGLIYRRKENV